MTARPIRLATRLLAFAVALPLASAAQQYSTDTKTQHPLACLPKAPGTTASELQFSVTGVTNPGATGETVVCPILVDTENGWTSDADSQAAINVGYRPGAAPGRITCTAFVASPDGSPVGASTVVSDEHIANSGNQQIQINVVGPAFDVWNNSKPVLSVACLLSPKVTLVRVQLIEKNQPTFHDGP
jgi:hypothetical protein